MTAAGVRRIAGIRALVRAAFMSSAGPGDDLEVTGLEARPR